VDAILHTNKGPVGLIVRRERGESTRSQGWASGVAGLGGRGGRQREARDGLVVYQAWEGGVQEKGAGRMQGGRDKSYGWEIVIFIIVGISNLAYKRSSVVN